MEEQISTKQFNLKYFYIKHSFIVNCVFLSLLFLSNCFVAELAYPTLSIAFLMVAFSDIKKGLSYIIYIFPFAWINMAFGMIMLILSLLLWTIKLLYIKIYREHVKLNISKRTLILFGVCIAYCLLPISGIWGVHTILKTLIFIIIFFLTYLIIKFSDEFRLQYNLRILALALLFASLYSLLRPYSLVLQQIIEVHSAGESFERFSALFYNPNNLGLVCEIVLSIMTYYYITKKSHRYDSIFFLTYVVLGVLTFSKAFAIVLVAVTIILTIHSIAKRNKASIMALGSLGLTALAMYLFNSELVVNYLSRFDFLNRIIPGITSGSGNASDILNDMTTSRFDLWLGYLNFLITHIWAIFFGRGLNAPRIGEFSPHSIYVGALYQLGIIGIALFACLIVFIVKDAKRELHYKIPKKVIITLLLFALLALIEDCFMYVA